MSTTTSFISSASLAPPNSATRRRSFRCMRRTPLSRSPTRCLQPGSPRVLQTRSEIKAWLEDMYARDMTHSVRQTVQDETGAAYTQACRYPDGTNVLCATVIGLDGGLISDQTVVQVWDER